jgi:DNA segregation ATPase FtsK/SpoIIIE-like protein
MKRDKLYAKAKKVVLEKNNQSISHLQRALRVGYNRAHEIIKWHCKPNCVNHL